MVVGAASGDAATHSNRTWTTEMEYELFAHGTSRGAGLGPEGKRIRQRAASAYPRFSQEFITRPRKWWPKSGAVSDADARLCILNVYLSSRI